MPVPELNFVATRRILIVLLTASILVPLLSLLTYGYYDHQRRIADANDEADRVCRVAEEQAVKVMDLNKEVSSRILELLGGSGDESIRTRQDYLHDKLNAIGGGFPQVSSISIFGLHGDLLASSKFKRVPNVSIAMRSDFTTARAIRPGQYVSLPMRSMVTQTDVFNTSTGRTGPDGRFMGVVSIALRREYFSRFYRELLGDDQLLTIALYRQDGGLLVRYPRGDAGATAQADATFAEALREHISFGRARVISTPRDVERILTYRRVGDFPLYVVSGYATKTVANQWRSHYIFIVAVAAVPCLAIWLLILFSLRQLKAQRSAWEHWRDEFDMRMSAEAAGRHMRRMSALGNLVASVAHEFNNLLMVVTSNTALARRKSFTDVETEVLAVERATVGASSLARRLLSVSRKQPLNNQVIDLNAWFAASASVIHASLGDAATLTVKVTPDTWSVFMDVIELELAVTNIAVNAREAMPLGGRFVVRSQNVHLHASDTALPDGQYVVLAFIDEGDGMSEDVAKHAFEPLFTTKASGAGTGLGLAQVLAACDQAGGTARIVSVPAHGTTVRLYLPRFVGMDDSIVKLDTALGPGSLKGSVTILLVEDNLDVAAGIAAVLEIFDCSVRHEVTADRALAVMTEGIVFDLVLSDVQMPGTLNGIDLAERLRRDFPTQRIALMTGYAEELERARRVGVPILAKPFDISDLQALLDSGANSVT